MTVTVPLFRNGQSSISLVRGQEAVGQVLVFASAAGISNTSRRVPGRCRLRLSGEIQFPYTSPSPVDWQHDVLWVDVNVVDENDLPPNLPSPLIVARSPRRATIRIPPGAAEQRTVRSVLIRNSNPPTGSSQLVTVSVTDHCGGDLVESWDLVPAASSPSQAYLRPGQYARLRLRLRARSDFFHTPRPDQPERCGIEVEANPSSLDLGRRAQLTVDVLDENDF